MQSALDALLSGTARDPVRHALGLEALDRQLRPLLPPGLATHVRLANVVDGRLVFLADSPVWHARLRLAADQLLGAARSVGLDVHEVAIRTTSQPVWPQPPQAAPRPRVPGPAAQEAFRAALDTLADPEPADRKAGG